MCIVIYIKNNHFFSKNFRNIFMFCRSKTFKILNFVIFMPFVFIFKFMKSFVCKKLYFSSSFQRFFNNFDDWNFHTAYKWKIF
ncbi:048R [Invertebrate iridescent virus 6]|uniref:048R n=1 Tax=Invertebrate iridescent virus 6 TaxID=176652 RepID=Q91G51_IIV6|nr:048R [Invertebrate iridescent virus 6]AAK81981.1 048R [Invertebrate iridescent virus 6]QMS79714.1 hypothetical protein IIV6-T1_053 [Invertebrate iridescent virus 6]